MPGTPFSGRRTARRAVLGCTLLVALAVVSPAAQQTVPAIAPAAFTASAALANDIETLIAGPGVSRGSWGIAVRSLRDNTTLFEHNARTLLVPASVAKLVTLSAAVDVVGWNFSFDTTLRATGPVSGGVLHGDLIVVGAGDPAIGGRAGEDFAAWIAALKQAGIARIDGRIIGDDDAIDDPRPGAMWAWDDLGYTSGALFGALNYAENRMPVTVIPGNAAGAPTTLTVASDATARPLINRTTTGAAGTVPQVWPEQRPGEPALTIAGSLPAGSRPARVIVSAGDPTRWFVNALRNQLRTAGIEVTGPAVDIDDLDPKPLSSSAPVLYVYHSKPLSDIAQPMLKDSINLYAEAVFRTITGVSGGRSNDDALAALRARVTAWGLSPDAVQVVDGSGLSRRDGLAAETLIAVLTRMYDPAGLSAWMTALPIAGVDGSLQNRMKGTAAEGNVRAKTGTMSNIRSLAGYVRTRDGEPLAFAIMANNFEGPGQRAQAIIDAIAQRLAEFTRQPASQ